MSQGATLWPAAAGLVWQDTAGRALNIGSAKMPKSETTKKRMPLMAEQDGYVVGIVDTPKTEGQIDWPLIANLLRELAEKIEECDRA